MPPPKELIPILRLLVALPVCLLAAAGESSAVASTAVFASSILSQCVLHETMLPLISLVVSVALLFPTSLSPGVLPKVLSLLHLLFHATHLRRLMTSGGASGAGWLRQLVEPTVIFVVFSAVFAVLVCSELPPERRVFTTAVCFDRLTTASAKIVKSCCHPRPQAETNDVKHSKPDLVRP